tara:strand:- start:33 stop:572 length:540 start_codon:yes stop_codon:yes gene_type:complete
MQIGVLALQGAVSEHEIAISKLGLKCIAVRNCEDLSNLSGLVMPGGESTTLRKLLKNTGLWEMLDQTTIPIMGTCAGAILIGNCGEENLGKMDIEINRNYYGRQKESFQKQITVKGKDDFDGVFIRAPAITRLGDNVEAIAWENGQIVGCTEGRNMALTFHPELTDDLSFHKMWLEMLS